MVEPVLFAVGVFASMVVAYSAGWRDGRHRVQELEAFVRGVPCFCLGVDAWPDPCERCALLYAEEDGDE